MYYFNTVNINMSKLKLAFSFLNTVSKIKNIFKNQEVWKSIDAVMLNQKTNHITKDKCFRMVKYNWIRNIPITVGDVRRSHKIYGPLLLPIKGRTQYKESLRFQETENFRYQNRYTKTWKPLCCALTSIILMESQYSISYQERWITELYCSHWDDQVT